MICQVIGWVAYFATHLYFTEFVGTVKVLRAIFEMIINDFLSLEGSLWG